MGRPARARALMDSALVQRPLDKILPGDRPYCELARFYAIIGDVPRAAPFSRLRQRTTDCSASIVLRNEVGRIMASSRLRKVERWKPRRICAKLWTRTLVRSVCFPILRAYEAVHKPQAALITYERYANTPWLWRYETDATELGFALQRIGELYTQQGEKEKATAAHEQLARLWRRADPELQTLVAAARKHRS